MPSNDEMHFFSFPRHAPVQTEHPTKPSREDLNPLTYLHDPCRVIYQPFPREEASMWIRLSVLFCHTLLFLRGLLAECLKIGMSQKERPEQKDFTPLHRTHDSVFTNSIYRMASDVVNRPIVGVPGAEVMIKERYSKDYGWTYEYTKNVRKVINFGSYNYTGFSDKAGPCAEAAAEAIEKRGIGNCATGEEAVQRELEEEIARFLGVEDAMCFGMGFREAKRLGDKY